MAGVRFRVEVAVWTGIVGRRVDLACWRVCELGCLQVFGLELLGGIRIRVRGWCLNEVAVAGRRAHWGCWSVCGLRLLADVRITFADRCTDEGC